MEKRNIEKLKIKSVLGFNGNIYDGLHLHPNLEYVLYPSASSVIIQNKNSKEQIFLDDEISNQITAMCISKSGNLVAAGYSSYPGFKAVIIVWQFNSRQKLVKYESHNDVTYSIRFSNCENYILSVGGVENCNNVICYDIKNEEICCGRNGSKSTSGDARLLYIFDTVDCTFATGGDNALRIWKFHPDRKYLEYDDISLFKYKRNICCIESNDLFLYCGTRSGDVLKFMFKKADTILIESVTLFGCFGKVLPSSKRTHCFGDADTYILGVRVLLTLSDDRLIIGCGDGTVELVEQRVPKIRAVDNAGKLPSPTLPVFVKIKSINVGSSVTTIRKQNGQLIVGTARNEIYFLDSTSFNLRTFTVCHVDTINDLAFSSDYSGIFATASDHSIRLWNAETYDQLLHVEDTESICNGIAFTNDGKLIISIWRDESLRIHTPRTGRNVCTVQKAHYSEPTVIVVTCGSQQEIITGDKNGEIRFWSRQQNAVNLIANIDGHRGGISAAHVKENLLLTAGSEGLCKIWNIENQQCKLCICCYTVCNVVKFHPIKKQIFTCGNDKRIRIWSSENGALMRQIEASRNAIKCSDLSADGELFAAAGFDLKIWKCAENVSLVGISCCSTNISKLRISPDRKTVLTVCEDNRLITWELPTVTVTQRTRQLK